MKTFIITSSISFNDFLNFYHEGDEINISSKFTFDKDSTIFLFFRNCSKQGVYAVCRVSFSQQVESDIAINKAVIERKETYPMISINELADLGINTKFLFQTEITDENDQNALFYLMDRFKPYIMNNCLSTYEVAKILDITIGQLNYWYVFKKHNPDNIFAKMLPDYIQENPRSTRYWPLESIKDLFNFKSVYPYNKRGLTSL